MMKNEELVSVIVPICKAKNLFYGEKDAWYN
jgi:hypothetical protein